MREKTPSQALSKRAAKRARREAVESDDDDDVAQSVEQPQQQQKHEHNLNERLAALVQAKFERNTRLTFEHLERLESELLLSSAYHQHIHGGFMRLLHANQRLFEQRGLSIVLLDDTPTTTTQRPTSQHTDDDSDGDEHLKRRVRRQRVLDCVAQLWRAIASNKKGDDSSTMRHRLGELVCAHYSVGSLAELHMAGEATLDSLLDELDDNSDTSNTDNNNKCAHIVCLEAVASSTNTPHTHRSDTSHEQLLARLEQCPLLANVAEFLDWPGNSSTLRLADLLTQLNRNEKTTPTRPPLDFIELNDAANTLLKVTRRTSLAHLRRAVSRGDWLNASGHLVSLVVVTYRRLELVPRSLLVNELHASFASLLARHSSSSSSCSSDEPMDALLAFIADTPHHHNYHQQQHKHKHRHLCHFVVELMHRIPLVLLARLLVDYVLEPLARLDLHNHDHAYWRRQLFAYAVASASLHSGITSLDVDVDVDVDVEDGGDGADRQRVANDARVRMLMALGERCGVNEWSAAACFESVFARVLEWLRLKKANNKTAPIAAAVCKVPSTHDSQEVQVSTAHREETSQRDEVEVKTDADIETDIDFDANDHGEAYKHVMAIRRRYGVGVALSERSRAVTDSLTGIIGRSLESLSAELYNKDMHFVLELIQNAG